MADEKACLYTDMMKRRMVHGSYHLSYGNGPPEKVPTVWAERSKDRETLSEFSMNLTEIAKQTGQGIKQF